MDERNASQNFINLNIGQLLNLLDNVNKNYVRKLENLKKNFVNNKYGISFNKICMNEGLLPNYTNIYIYKTFLEYICVCWLQIFLNASFIEDQGELSIDYFSSSFLYRSYQ